jgi:hypothetical protein
MPLVDVGMAAIKGVPDLCSLVPGGGGNTFAIGGPCHREDAIRMACVGIGVCLYCIVENGSTFVKFLSDASQGRISRERGVDEPVILSSYNLLFRMSLLVCNHKKWLYDRAKIYTPNGEQSINVTQFAKWP